MRRLIERAVVTAARGSHRGIKLALGRNRRPVFFDVDAVHPALRRIDAAFEQIRREAVAVLPERHRIPRYHELDPAQEAISRGPNDWRMLLLYAHTPPRRRADGEPRATLSSTLCPRTVEVVRSVPGVTVAFLSILEPGKSVPAHTGPYSGCLRYHLGLVVPERDPPTLRVRDRHYTWREGESIVFDDSYEHEVHNRCAQARVVLIVDFVRPLPGLLGVWNRSVIAAARWIGRDDSADVVVAP